MIRVFLHSLNPLSRVKFIPVLFIFMLQATGMKAATYYVNEASPAPAAPYNSWLTAATNIQDAVSLTSSGDTVLVTNGVYAYGGAAIVGTLTNRVALTNAITVQSVNGPWVTTILGAGMTNRASAVRCAWLTNGASLVGFTLTAGATLNSGNPLTQESGGGVWCASTNAYVRECLIVSNTTAEYGAGTYQGTLTACQVSGNTNPFTLGGAVYESVLNNCTVISNGCYGTVSPYAMTNCIIYYNGTGGSQNINGYGSASSHCCTIPALAGASNITNAPDLYADGVHLANNSPCRGAGLNIGIATDIFGNTYSNPPSVGCAEWTPAPLVATPQITLTGNPVGFSIGNFAFAGSPTFSFIWLQNGVPLSDNGHFSGSQTTNLTASGVSLSDAGNYQVVVSNTYGMVTSLVATLVVHCVNAAGTSPSAPYLTWATAATGIQDAIAASSAEDVILVTNGLYATGGISMDGIITNRVSINKAILVQSIHGANATFIQGAWDPATNGPTAIRSVWMTTNAIISGFSIFGGATRAAVEGSIQIGGGVIGLSNSIVANCNIYSNSAAGGGGGAYNATLFNCLLIHNTVPGIPGYGSADNGGGAGNCILQNCLVSSNYAYYAGGGTANSTLKNCAVIDNSAGTEGGGVDGGSLFNCTVVRNSTTDAEYDYGGGVYSATLVNCIVYANSEADTAGVNTNYYGGTFSYSCSAPLPSGTGNISANPQLLADGIHLGESSPCIGAGNAGVVSGTDIDGQPWNNPPSIGCDEWYPTPIICIQPTFQAGTPPDGLTLNVVTAGQPPFVYSWTQNGVPIQDNGHFSGSSGANLVVNNLGPADAGLYQVVVSNSSGSATSTVAQVTLHVVNAAGSNPVAPYSSWATAATDIQDAINAAAPGDIVLVTNGVYATGGLAMAGTLTNRVVLNLPITVMSVNGFRWTAIQGAWDPMAITGPGAVRCAWVGDGAVLNGFTLQNGATSITGIGIVDGPLSSGGGVWCNSTNGIVSNCVLTNNAAAYSGGGMANGTLDNSLIINNQAEYGGGVLEATLNNCTVINNLAIVPGGGGGTYEAIVRNSIVLNNFDPFASDNYYLNDPLSAANLYYSSCSSPLTPSNNGDINATDAKFLDLYHISTISPCYGTGNPAYASGYDLDGEPWNNPPSMGCSEIVQSNLVGPLTVNCSAFLTNTLVNRSDSFTGSIQGRAAYVNWSFGDGPVYTNFGYFSNHQWTNAGNYLVTLSAYNNSHPGGVSTNLLVYVQPIDAVQVQSPGMVTNGFSFQFSGQNQANYTILYATNLAPPVAWQTLQTIYSNTQTNIQILDPATTNAARFYRISAQ